jgi:hypothetical protein
VSVKAVTEIEVLRWPEELARRNDCAERGIPCLLLVDTDAAPPETTLPSEDWIRIPADERDLLARMNRLGRLTAHRAPSPTIDDTDIFHVDDRWIALSSTEAALARALIKNAGGLVRRRDLLSALTGERRPRTLDLQIHRLRRRIAAVGFTVVAVRGRGYALQPLPFDSGSSEPDVPEE